MKTLKLTEVQEFRLKEAHLHLSTVLREIKRLKLEGKALDQMRHLEKITGDLEAFVFFR